MRKRILKICRDEEVELQDGVIRTLATVSHGDFRKVITNLQSAVRLRGPSVTSEAVLEVAGTAPDGMVENLWKACQCGYFGTVHKVVGNVLACGFSTQQILIQLLHGTFELSNIRDVQRAKILQQLALVDKKLMDGADEYLQLLNVSAKILRIMMDKK